MSDAALAERLAAVQARIAQAAQAAGRAPSEVTLIAVSKTQEARAVCAAYDAGVRDFGENTAQELEAKATALAASGRTPRWHFIGRLQRNKVNLVLRHAHLIHTVDREALIEALRRRALGDGIEALVQVNIGDEPQKGGVAPAHALALCDQLAAAPGVRLRGLMAVPPADVPPGPFFTQLAALLEALKARPAGAAARILSMGMSHDYEEAIRCGATMVRVGTAIFGARLRPEGVGP